MGWQKSDDHDDGDDEMVNTIKLILNDGAEATGEEAGLHSE